MYVIDAMNYRIKSAQCYTRNSLAHRHVWVGWYEQQSEGYQSEGDAVSQPFHHAFTKVFQKGVFSDEYSRDRAPIECEECETAAKRCCENVELWSF